MSNILAWMLVGATFLDAADVNISIREAEPDVSFDDGMVNAGVQYAFLFDDFIIDFPGDSGTIPVWSRVHTANVSLIIQGDSGAGSLYE
jgi:hypothetical protein